MYNRRTLSAGFSREWLSSREKAVKVIGLSLRSKCERVVGKAVEVMCWRRGSSLSVMSLEARLR